MSVAAQVAGEAAAGTPFAAPAAVGAATTSGLAGAGEVTFALLIVLLVIFGCAWCVKRLRTFARPQGRVLAIVDDLAVGQKERVVLLACGGERLLVGVAAGQVSLLRIVPPAAFAAADGVQSAETPAAAPTPDFRTVLRRSLGLTR
jgi:flagellar protein FliO/FliZ